MTNPRGTSARLPASCDDFLKAFASSSPEELGCGLRQTNHAWNGERLSVSAGWSHPERGQIASIRLQWFPCRAYLWLGSLDIAAPLRRRGLGTRLVGAIESAAWATGAQSIRLFSEQSSRCFWQHLGYGTDANTRYLLKTQPARS